MRVPARTPLQPRAGWIRQCTVAGWRRTRNLGSRGLQRRLHAQLAALLHRVTGGPGRPALTGEGHVRRCDGAPLPPSPRPFLVEERPDPRRPGEVEHTASSRTLPTTVTGQSRPAVAVQNDGRLALFFFAPGTRTVYWSRQTAVNGTSWTSWVSLQASASGPPAVITDIKGVIHFVVLDSNGRIYERTQSSADSSSWTQWQAGYLGGPFAAM